MIGFLGRRLLHTVPVIVGITLASFVLIHLVPGDPIRIMLGGKATKEHIAEVSHTLKLDRPLPEQYLTFVGGATHGDLGESIILQRPVPVAPSRAWGETEKAIHATEHALLPETIRLIAAGRVRVDDDNPRLVHIDPETED